MNLYQVLIKLKSPRILILRMSSFGDITKTIPVYFYLKKVLPNSHIYWLVKEKYTRLLEVFNIAEDKILTSYSLLSNSYFDAILDFQANLKSGFVSAFIPAQYKIGFSPRYTKELNFIFRNNFLAFYSKTRKSISLNKLTVNSYNKPYELLYKLGFPHCPQAEIKPKVSPQINKKIDDWLSSKNIGNFVLIHPGSSKKGKNKRWEVENFIKLVKNIKEGYNISAVILLGKDEEELQSLFESVCAVVNFAEGVEEMIALMKKCALFIGNDSGPLHLASILGVKTLGIYPASNPYIMAHPGSFYVSNYFYLSEKQNKKISITIPFEEVWKKVNMLISTQ